MITKKDSESIVKKVFDEKTNFLEETINENARTRIALKSGQAKQTC